MEINIEKQVILINIAPFSSIDNSVNKLAIEVANLSLNLSNKKISI